MKVYAHVSEEISRKILASCAHAGIPAPHQIIPMAPRLFSSRFQLQFEDSALVYEWIQGMGAGSLRRFQHGFSAKFLMDVHGASVPVVPLLSVPHATSQPTALQGPVSPALGASLYRQGVLSAAQLSKVLVRTALALQQMEGTGFGFTPFQKGFLPQTQTWSEEWQRQRSIAQHCAQRTGDDLGSLGAKLTARIDAHLPAIQSARCTLVHGQLLPSALRYQPHEDSWELQAVTDWDNAHVGDPVSCWARWLLLCPELVPHLRTEWETQGGAEHAGDHFWERVLVYAWGDAFFRASHAAELRMLGRHTAANIVAVRAKALAERSLQLEEVPWSGVATTPAPLPRGPLLRTTPLRALASLRPPLANQVGVLLQLLTLPSFLARQPSAQTTANIWRVHQQFDALLKPTPFTLEQAPPLNVEDWLCALLETCHAQWTTQPETCQWSCALMGAAVQALDGEEASSATLRGIEAYTHQLLALDLASMNSLTASKRLYFGLWGLHTLEVVAARVEGLEWETLKQELHTQCVDALDVLLPFPPPREEESWEDSFSQGVAQNAWTMLPLLAAMDTARTHGFTVTWSQLKEVIQL
jgi:hypothetical protein